MRTDRRCDCRSESSILSRRELLQFSELGLGSLALACLLKDDPLWGADGPLNNAPYSDLLPRQSHFPPQAKAVIPLYQEGGPRHLDLFDPKPELMKRNGQPHPDGVETFMKGNKNVLKASPFQFRRRRSRRSCFWSERSNRCVSREGPGDPSRSRGHHLLAFWHRSVVRDS